MMGKTKNPKLFAPGDIKKFHEKTSAKKAGESVGHGVPHTLHGGVPGFKKGSADATLNQGHGQKKVDRSTKATWKR